MKLSAVFQTLAIASFSTLGYATIFLERLPSNLTIGEKVKLNWSADHDYVSTLSHLTQSRESLMALISDHPDIVHVPL
jgi:hypothetical protein